MPFSSWANTASSSNAERVAASSNVLPSQEYMESDGFDTLDVPALMSDGGDSSSTIDFTGSKLNLRYYDMMNRVKDVSVNLNADGYGSIPRPSDFVKSVEIEIRLFKSNLPSAGKYNMNVHFGSNTGGFTYTDAFVWSGKNNKNAGMQQQQTSIDFSQGSGDFNISTIVEIGNIDYLNVGAYSSGIIPPVGGFFTVSFTKVSGSVAPDVTTAGGSYSSGDALADNTARQVEQGDTIIELIKNTIQTISFQLTSFWNQLAGEFTNLYNKMNQHHQESMDKVDEQIDNDNANTDKVTTAIEAHGNFIIEGLKSLFIPSDEYFKSWFDGMYQFFNDRLGFLMLPFDLLVRMVDIYTSAGSSSAGIPFPEFKWVDGTVIIPAQTVQFDFLNTDWGKGIQNKLYFVGNLIMIGALLSLMHRKFEEVLRN